MRFLTDRKRAAGLGSAKAGTEHHIHMMITSVALVPQVIAFIFTFGAALGRPYEEVLAYYQRPLPAIIAALTLLVGFIHFRNGVQTAIEDYMGGLPRRVAILVMICISYGTAALGVLAIVRLAL